jgi:HK97 family phage major capsid protein
MSKILELKQKQSNITGEIQDFLNKFTDSEMTVDDRATLAAMEARFDALGDQVKAEERQVARNRALGEVADPQTPAINAVSDAFRRAITIGDAESIRVYNALQQSSPTQAGYLVAEEKFVADLIKDLADGTFMRRKAKVLEPLVGAQSLGFPTRTAAMSSFAWGTEIQAPSADATLAFGKREFKAKPGTSEILVSKTLLRNAKNGDQIVRAEIAEELSKNEETAYMTGDGVLCPLGVFTASNDGIPVTRDVSAGNTQTELKFDGLINCKMSVKEQYRRGAEWIMHRDAIKQVMKLKDSSGAYIWQPSLVAGQPDRLIGDPVNESEYAPNTFTAGLYLAVYGNLKHYWIVDSLAMEIQVLAELYARTNQMDYITRIETDGAPIVSSAFARAKLA